MRDIEQCNAFVVHLRMEHQRLHDVVREIEKIFQSRMQLSRERTQPLKLVEALSQLREELDRHFVEEETGGCMEEAVCRCPSLSPHANELEGQHPILLDRLDAIIGQTRNSSTARSIDTLEKEFRDFATQLRAHEAGENRILKFAFGAGTDLDEEA